MVNNTRQRSQDPTVDLEDFVDVLVGRLHLFTMRGLHMQECPKDILMLVLAPTSIKSQTNLLMLHKPMIKDYTTMLKTTEVQLPHIMQLHLAMVVADCNHHTSHICSS